MSLRIALVGYGKMGQAIEKEAIQRGHAICLRVDAETFEAALQLRPAQCDCIIEFTHPEAALSNYEALLGTGIPIITGTTGWLAKLTDLKTRVLEEQSSFLYSSNFSVGVNVMFKVNQMLANLMNAYPQYDCYIEEAHHRHKKDAPSGTAYSLADQIIDRLDRKSKVADSELKHRPPTEDELSVAYTRAGEIIGAHAVSYISDIDKITISHEAYNRRGFALGAVIAAEWIQGKQGFFEFSDIFQG